MWVKPGGQGNRKSVGIVLFDEVEVLDYCGPFEVFSVTRLGNLEQRSYLIGVHAQLPQAFGHAFGLLPQRLALL